MKNQTRDLLIVAFIIFFVDLPWLSSVSGNQMSIVKDIQGGAEPKMRPLAGVIVYLALAQLLLRTESVKDAFLVGAATQAVYDFTVMAVFRDQPLQMAIADTMWGGILFALAYTIKGQFRL